LAKDNHFLLSLELEMVGGKLQDPSVQVPEKFQVSSSMLIILRWLVIDVSLELGRLVLGAFLPQLPF